MIKSIKTLLAGAVALTALGPALGPAALGGVSVAALVATAGPALAKRGDDDRGRDDRGGRSRDDRGSDDRGGRDDDRSSYDDRDDDDDRGRGRGRGRGGDDVRDHDDDDNRGRGRGRGGDDDASDDGRRTLADFLRGGERHRDRPEVNVRFAPGKLESILSGSHVAVDDLGRILEIEIETEHGREVVKAKPQGGDARRTPGPITSIKVVPAGSVSAHR